MAYYNPDYFFNLAYSELLYVLCYSYKYFLKQKTESLHPSKYLR